MYHQYRVEAPAYSLPPRAHSHNEQLAQARACPHDMERSNGRHDPQADERSPLPHNLHPQHAFKANGAHRPHPSTHLDRHQRAPLVISMWLLSQITNKGPHSVHLVRMLSRPSIIICT